MSKKGEKQSTNKLLFHIALIPITILIISLSANAQNECKTTDLSTCGYTITTIGHGAVELCQNCFVCGASDGVCPEDFSDGNPETDANKTFVLLRVSNNDRPPAILPNGNPIIYDTGREGCEVINGTCNTIFVKAKEGDPWIPSPWGQSCTDSVASLNSWYVAANCTAPKTAGCQYCPDPDCTTNLIGITFDNITNQTIPAKVNVVSLNKVLAAKVDSDGTYFMNPFRGNVKVICTAQDYLVTEKNVFLQRGKNIVDCPMGEASCSPECTLPDINGFEVCASKCDNQNSCNYANDDIKAICEGVRAGSTVVINRTNSTHVLAVTCCTGDYEYIYRPLFRLDADKIPNLLRRDYRKMLNGIPITLRIITYNKE